MRLITAAALSAFVVLGTGCVTKQTHDATLEELSKTREALGSAQKTINDQERVIKRNTEEIARTNRVLSDLNLRKAALQQELEKTQKLLSASQAQIETLRQIEAETQKRNEIYARFVQKLQGMIDGGQLTLTIENGRIVINLPENVLFATGSATINAGGEETLRQIAALLKEFSDRRFQIEGHTDNVPIHNARFASNWELSTGRALSVVHLMLSEGVASQNVSAAGFGEFHPRADNTTPEGRALNRRIEIIMQPNLDILSSELPKIAR